MMEIPENTLESPKREQFGSRIAFVLASMGGAIGLGNVWKFPYMVGRYGGAAFIVVYIIALLVIGAPVLMTEFAIGRKTGTSYTSALKKLLPGTKWYLLGIIGVIALTLTLGFYGGIAGWTVAYLFKSITGVFVGMDAAQVGAEFGSFITNSGQVILWLAVMLGITTFVVLRGVKGGIEKVCNILLPVLFVMIVFLAIRFILLPGAGAGLEFYLMPKLENLNGETVVAGVGQALFTWERSGKPGHLRKLFGQEKVSGQQHHHGRQAWEILWRRSSLALSFSLLVPPLISKPVWGLRWYLSRCPPSSHR